MTKVTACCLGGVAGLSLQAQAQPASASADADYLTFAAMYKAGPSFPFDNTTASGLEKYMTWLDEHQQTAKSAALAFYAAHPTDPRRWELVMACVKSPPFFIRSFGPDILTKGSQAIIADMAAKEAWDKQGEALTAAMLASADAPPTMREEADWLRFAADFRATTAARKQGEAVDYRAFPARFDAHVAKYAGLDAVAYRAVDYLGALERELKVPEPSLEIWKHLLDAPNAALREQAAGRVRFYELKSKPMEMAFTAADGRAVDLKRLRGKVVLIDFWATWCGPCKAEIPNIVAVYKKYHDQGFEVVGISLENGQLAPKDTPPQSAAKLAKAKQVLTAFTAANDMPWPQYFDGKFWKNDISTQYALQSIPAMFLLDQEGKVMSTNARGELLETAVKKLLKL